MDHQEEEEDVCRVCRSGPEPGQPLFHPCKCSGSIRFVHQDCLLTWLQSSRRKYCELCGHSFSFTRVYDPAMPTQLPPLLFASRLLRQAFKLLLLVLRSCLVGITWLGIVPWLTIWAFRLYFVMGNGLAWTMSGQGGSPQSPLSSLNSSDSSSSNTTELIVEALSNLTDSLTNSSSNSTASKFFIPSTTPQNHLSFFSHSLIMTVAKDTFEGQILTASIVITFLAGFLLREWTLQAPARNEDEEDELAGGPADRLAAMPNVDPVRGRVQVDFPVAVEQVPVAVGKDGEEEEEEQEETTEEEIDQEPTDREALRRAREKYFGASPGPASDREERTEENERIVERIPSSLSPQALKHRRLRKRYRAGSSNSSTDSSPITKFEPLPPKPTENGQPVPSSSSSHARSRPRRQASPTSENESLPDLERSRAPSYYTEDSFPKEPEDEILDSTSFDGRPFNVPPTSPFTFRSTPPSPSSIPLPPLPSPSPFDEHSRPFSFSGGPSNSSRPLDFPPPPPLSPTLESSSTNHPRPNPNPEDNPRPIFFPVVRAPLNEEEQAQFRRRLEQLRPNEVRRAPLDVPRDVGEEDDDDEDEGEGEGNGEDDEEDPFDLPPLLVEPRGRRAELEAAERQRMEEDDEEDGLRDDEMEAQNDRMMEEDLEGILEAIGLRGPILQLLQNSALMTLILSICVACTIFIPFTLGKTLLLINLLDVVCAFRLPVLAVRFVTDPILKIGHTLGSRYLLPPLDAALLPVIEFVHSLLPPKSIPSPDTLIEPSSLSSFVSSAQEQLLVGFAFVEEGIGRVLGSGSKDVASSSSSQTWASIVNKAPIFETIASTVTSLGEDVGDLFALLGTASRDAFDYVKMVADGKVTSVGFASLAQGDTPSDRFFATWVGYSTVMLALLLWFGTSSDTRGWSKTVKDVFKQNAIVVKLAFFMGIELVVFPLGCGILLDFCLLPLFQEKTGLARAAFQARAPFISMFLHWVGGTLFMFGFASMLSHGRKQLRRGTFFFVRDPQDPTFQPVREIIERGTFTQLHKLGASAVMYFSVIFVSVGLTLNAIRWILPGVLPLLWKPSQPISQIPIDLLILHFVAPPAIKILRPHRRFRKVLEKWWSLSVDALRLSSYFFGPPVTEADFTTEAEADTPVRLALDKVVAFLGRYTAKDTMRGVGGLVRVPNSDTLAMTANRRVFVLVDRQHSPIDSTELELLVAQNKKTLGDGRNPLEDFCVVYLPPYIRNRVLVLLFSLWVSLVVLVGASLSVPLAIGRFFFSVLLEKEVHDGYSFAAGGTIALCNFLASRSLLRKIRRWGQAERVRKTSLLGRIKRNILWGANIAYLATAFGLVLPLALSFVFELYLISPMKSGLTFSEPSVLFVWELWSLGLLWMHILWSTRRFLPPSMFNRALDRVLVQVAQLQVKSLTDNIIGPLLGLCVMLVVFPFVTVMTLHPLFGRPERKALDVRLVYPVLAACAISALVLHFLLRKLSAWRVKLRESEFLVELRLRNLDARGPTTAQSAPGEKKGFTPDHLA
ncbi:hypothetical protein BDY24DRAFT_223553 [Mrakia frigida]|uniref:uncharacterized protein n=1 Tax=Mrakia frigida TaxID=29902 RepID=UPI003FCBF6AE